MSRYGKILICICLVDLFLTVLGLQLGVIGEANGFLLRVFRVGGVEALVVAKALMSIPCIYLLERELRNPHPRKSFSAETYYRVAIWVYVLSFIALTFAVNFF